MPEGTEIDLLRYLVLALERQGARSLNALMAPLELTTSQAEVLRVIETYGPMSIREVGEHLICESGSPSRLVAALVSAGVVRRESNPDDRRGTLLSLTPAGRLLAGEVRKIEDDYTAALRLAVNEEEAATLTRILLRLVTEERLQGALARRFGVREAALAN